MIKNKKSGENIENDALPKHVLAGKKIMRTSANVLAGKSHVEGDKKLAAALVEALKQKGEFNRATQGFHSYPARLHPEGARLMLEALDGDDVADPFCGGGTVAVEGLISGRRVFASDLNPIAVRIAKCRCALLDNEALWDFSQLCKNVLDEAIHLRSLDKRYTLPASILKIKSWYHRDMFEELAALHTSMRAYHSEHRILCEGVFSSLVVKYSLRASETSNKIVPVRRNAGAVFEAFEEKCGEYMHNLRQLRDMVPENTPDAHIEVCDAREMRFDDVGLILTSPPYPGTYDYILLQQLRQGWFGIDPNRTILQEIGSRRHFKQRCLSGYRRWCDDTKKWILSAAKSMKKGAKICIVVGEGMSREKALPVAKPTREAAEVAELRFVASGAVERKDPATSTKKTEFALVFEK